MIFVAKLLARSALLFMPSSKAGFSKVIIIGRNCNGKGIEMVETANQDTTITFLKEGLPVFGIEIEARKIGRSG